MDSSQMEELKFLKEKSSLKGEVALSGYIFSKEFVESFRIPKTLANKKTSLEFVKIFSEKNPVKLVDFLLSVNEKKRTAQNDQELAMLAKLIKKNGTEDDVGSTPYFSTGYIELHSPKENNERYFIKISDINKKNISVNSNKTKIKLLKAISVYSFQNILSSLNLGGIEKESEEGKLFDRLEKLSFSICGLDCPLDFTKDLSQFALNVGKIVNFEVVGNTKIENLDDFDKYVLAQQWCVLKNFSNACHVKELDQELVQLSESQIMKGLIKKHKTSDGLCKFLQK